MNPFQVVSAFRTAKRHKNYTIKAKITYRTGAGIFLAMSAAELVTSMVTGRWVRISSIFVFLTIRLDMTLSEKAPIFYITDMNAL